MDIFFVRKIHEFQHRTADPFIKLLAEGFVHSKVFIERSFFDSHHGDKHRAETHGLGIIRNGANPILKRVDIDSAEGDAKTIDRNQNPPDFFARILQAQNDCRTCGQIFRHAPPPQQFPVRRRCITRPDRGCIPDLP